MPRSVTIHIGKDGSYEEAKGHPKWEADMQEEIEALNKIRCQNQRIASLSLVNGFVVKKKNETVDICKAQLVARCFSQSCGLDYEEHLV